LFPQLHNWHTTIVCAGEHKDVVANAIGQHREKFGRAEVKRGVAKSALGCRVSR
jgi:hypothetical protein